MVKATDAEGHAVTGKYDVLGRNTHIIKDPAGINIVTEVTYVLFGNKLSEKDGEGNITSYQYDLINRLKMVTQTVGGQSIQTEYDYDIVEGSLVKNKVTDALNYRSRIYLEIH